MQIFVKLKYFCKRFWMAITWERNLWGTMAVVITLSLFHEDFNTTTTSLLETSDKTINQIQNVLQSKKAKNISKKPTGRGTGNFAIVFRDKKFKKKTNSNNNCYNLHKLRDFRKHCFLLDKRLKRTTQKSQREESQKMDLRRSRGRI